MAGGLRIYNKNKILTIDNNYSGVALRRVIKASDLPTAKDIVCYNDPLNSFGYGTLKARTISTFGDEFKAFAIGPLNALVEYKIQIVKTVSGELFLAYQNESDIENIKLYTYGYNYPYKTGKNGLRVYNDKNQLTFDSNQKQMLIEAGSVNKRLGYNCCVYNNIHLDKLAITMSVDINMLGTTGKPFATQVQYYVYADSSNSFLYAAWVGGLTASSVRNAAVAHMIVNTEYC